MVSATRQVKRSKRSSDHPRSTAIPLERLFRRSSSKADCRACNHSLLIAMDGSERPIDDCAAVINETGATSCGGRPDLPG